MRWFFMFMLAVVLAASGCGQVSARQDSAAGEDIRRASPVAASASTRQIKDKMYLQYQQWKGTPYRYGGLSKQGVDCSGFVHLTFAEQLGMKIPRSTRLLSQTGKEIGRDRLRAGDLVFFKTSVKVRHVGIYVGNGKFLHASTKRGVIISNLSDSYWKARYWHARRLIF